MVTGDREMADGRRIRLLFEENDDILSPTQKSEGLNRCLLMLKPQFHITIADFSAHILQSFGLEPACPHGILLYIDDFLLPPFESSDILDGKDIISVRKKKNNATIALDVPETGNAQKAQNDGALLLANEEFETESDSSEGEEESDELVCEEDEVERRVKERGKGKATSNKRKAVDELQGSKKRRKHFDVDGNGASTSQTKKNHAERKKIPKPDKKLRALKKKGKRDDKEKAETGTDNVDTSPITKSGDHDQCQDNGNDGQEGSAGIKKMSSRSARRKKAKRQWIREMKMIQIQAQASQSKGHDWKKPNKAERKTKNNWKKAAKPDEKEDDGEPKGLLHWKSWAGKTNWDNKKNSEAANQNGGRQKNGWKDAVAPAVTRPGHIRFEQSDKDHDVEQSRQPAGRYQANNRTPNNKRKGQKWVKDKPWFSSRKDDEDMEKARAEIHSLQNELRFNEPISFDKLPPLCELPKDGDVIGYRLIELSSTWTPELSPYQVGLVAWCSDSGKLLLLRFTECPTTPKKSTENDSDPQPNNSLYKADGPLEIDFKTLIDVRIVKDSITAGGVEATAANGDSAGPLEKTISPTPPASNDNRTEVSSSKSGRNLWEQFSEALSDKKTQENSWGKKPTEGRPPSSYTPYKPVPWSHKAFFEVEKRPAVWK